jgi:hypothetical protein
MHILLYSNAMLIAVRCFAHTMDEGMSWPVFVTKCHGNVQTPKRHKRCRFSNNSFCPKALIERAGWAERAERHLNFWCVAVTLIAILSTAWAQHLTAMNVELGCNSICIVNSTVFFLRDLVQFQTYRVHFQQKSVTLILGNHRAMYSWHSTP